jgi:hypothetical protein
MLADERQVAASMTRLVAVVMAADLLELRSQLTRYKVAMTADLRNYRWVHTVATASAITTRTEDDGNILIRFYRKFAL